MRSEEPKAYAMFPGLLYYFLTCHIAVKKHKAQNKIYKAQNKIYTLHENTPRREGS